ncbi:MAG: NADPH-dependent F420 reductase [Pusillimonas sp.]
MKSTPYTIAVLGGTGAQGGGLALRWARAGHRVIIGSRTLDGAVEGAKKLNAQLGHVRLDGAANEDAAAAADIVVLTVPYSVQSSTALAVQAQLQSKILVDATVPLIPPKVNRVQLPQAGSAVAALQARLGQAVRVVSAFQNVSAHHLRALDSGIDCDVLICGDDPQAREVVIGLTKDLGMRGVSAGPICNSAAAEALTSILISINQRYKVPGAGIRITGLPDSSDSGGA